jgi:hypothetical protein
MMSLPVPVLDPASVSPGIQPTYLFASEVRGADGPTDEVSGALACLALVSHAMLLNCEGADSPAAVSEHLGSLVQCMARCVCFCVWRAVRSCVQCCADVWMPQWCSLCSKQRPLPPSFPLRLPSPDRVEGLAPGTLSPVHGRPALVVALPDNEALWAAVAAAVEESVRVFEPRCNLPVAQRCPMLAWCLPCHCWRLCFCAGELSTVCCAVCCVLCAVCLRGHG